MALPMNAAPTYNLVVPSTKQKIKFRPFLMKEQKALMLAQQSEDPDTIIDTLKSIIKGCVTEELDIDKLAIFDLEYIFLKLRAKSVGETVEVILNCDEDHGEQDKLAKVKHTVNLEEIEVKTDPKHTTKIELFGDVGIMMKYPSFGAISKFRNLTEESADTTFQIVADSIDYIYNSDEIFYAKDQTKEELTQFIDNLTSEQFGKLQEFFNTMPRLTHDISYKCPVCGKAHNIRLEGIESFF